MTTTISGLSVTTEANSFPPSTADFVHKSADIHEQRRLPEVKTSKNRANCVHLLGLFYCLIGIQMLSASLMDIGGGLPADADDTDWLQMAKNLQSMDFTTTTSGKKRYISMDTIAFKIFPEKQ
ncbi:hypothetical protein H4C48_21150 [Pseudomonas asiatica]|uniref:hypothetical protein n=1 Tax=Pseudomonas asiatica TaxID=2219225 RepID=UPI0015F83752|nr:hypothetical protein [Pseudomonas asiatica]MBA6112868.1 hypothetical protein [Pseudomonas asiatica]